MCLAIFNETDFNAPKVEQVGPYRNGTAPAAAKFGVGALNIVEIQQATDARGFHNEALSYRPTDSLPTAPLDTK